MGPLKDSSGAIVDNSEEMCGLLNDFFTSVYTKEDISGVLPEVEKIFKGDPSKSLQDVEITPEVVLKYFGKMRQNKAPGVDGFGTRLFNKELANCIHIPLSIIFRKSLDDGLVPSDWKMANITAIYKTGSRCDACNYRPISLTVQGCKVMEAIIRDRINEHLQKHDLIRSSQHGFVKNRSCLTNLLEFVESVRDYVDRGTPVDAIYLDLRKAFDKVPHHRLKLKLNAHGVDGKIAGWISDWLDNRQQRVVLNGVCSNWSNVLSGVPQGSVLGPMLFIIYVNDFDSKVVNKLLKFADDAKLFGPVSNTTEVERLRKDLLTLCEWTEDWMMMFNTEKSKVVHFGANNPRVAYSIENKVLDGSEEERDLGVIVQSNLKVSSQCAKVVKTANKILGLIKRTFVTRDVNTIRSLYKSLVRPHLEYCVQAWRPWLKKDIELIEGVQHRATKIITGFNNLSYEQRLAAIGLTTLETRRLRGDLIEVFKIIKGCDKVDYQKFFQLSTSQLRGHTYKLYKIRVLTNIGKFAFSNRVVDYWNKLPEDVVSCSNVNSFKGKIDRIIKNDWGLV